MRYATALILTLAALAGAARAAPPTPADANPRALSAPDDPVPLAGVVVTSPSKTLPAVVSTYPAAGATIKPGALILKITFDQRMRPDGWRFDRGDDGYPSCLARPRLLPDEKTFVLLCTVGGAGKFSIQLNSPGDGGFANLANQRATPMTLQFTTSEGASLSSIKEAMKSAGLKDEDDPIMDKRPVGAQQASAATPSF